jgi:hypothetical protein
MKWIRKLGMLKLAVFFGGIAVLLPSATSGRRALSLCNM